MFVRSCVLSVGMGMVSWGIATAQQAASVNRPYDGIQAGLDAYRLAEEQRQAGVSQQLFLNDQMRFWNGYPTSRGETIYYGYSSPYYGFATPYLTRANLDYLYAYGAGPSWAGTSWIGATPLSVFQPWPYVPGNIYGYPLYYQPARQPIGQQQLQTAPNRWESHPVYSPPIAEYRPLPPVDSPLLERTLYAAPKETTTTNPSATEPVPPGPVPSTAPLRGPREY